MKSGSAVALFLHIFLLSLLAVFTTTLGAGTDIACLKSIKASLQDPHSYLKSSWDFSNTTEGFICQFKGVTCWPPDENKVLNLTLSDMGLKGNFPEGIRKCTSLTGLNLSNNELQGPIPSGIGTMIPFVTSLDLSFNKLSGKIPSTIADCSHLNVLKLDHNRLTGQIPPELGFLSRIKLFNVANNQLPGPVPNFQSDGYANNIGLCGAALGTCRERPRKFQYWSFDYSFEGGFAIGFVVFAVSTLVLYTSYCVPWVHIGERNEMMTIPAMVLMILKDKEKKFAEFDQFASFSTLEFLLEKEVTKSENFVTRMRFVDLLQATENFSPNNIIGFGETGSIYKATLPNGWSLAVKKFFNSQHSEEYFITELKILGRLRHNNIIRVIGFCKESRKRHLVYNYVSNGNLSDWLHSGDGKKKNVLTWPLRMKIAVGLARGLAWLHHCSDFRVAHLNVNSKCVLLDLNFEPKLSNFGIATFINPNEIANSNNGYVMDMEFWEQCFVKEDVFNFGIIMLELITGKKVASLNMALTGENFDRWTTGVIDKLLIGEGYKHEIFECIKIANKCMQPFPEQRPSMFDVYTRISIIRDRFFN